MRALTEQRVTTAFKEWDVVVAALEAGRQALLIRKGGLDDPEMKLPLPAGRFWLYPTLFHERGVFLEEEEHALLVPGMHRRPRATAAQLPEVEGHPRAPRPGTVRLRAVAEIAEVVPATSLEALEALLPRTVWTAKYARLRFRWRPEERPLVVVLRVATLPAAVEIEERPEYGGCRSVVELLDPPDATAARAVWSRERLDREIAEVRAVVGGP